MPTSRMNGVIQHLRRAAILRDGAGLTDGQLLTDYISCRDEAALAALVHRHGPMVWGVCRRVLANHHDAEDAFQATFLVLVRRAASIASRELLANWLYGVAHQTAMKARATVAKRKVRERQVTEMPESAVREQDPWNDLQPFLDQELSRLPDIYRAVIVLCDLEGKTRKEAARQLSLPEGTVGSRLARARVMLAKRLARHGLVMSGGALAVLVSQNAASAGVPSSVVSSTIKAASLFAAGQAAATGLISVKVTALTEGVLKTMLVTKLKTALAVLVLAVAAVGGLTSLTVPTAPVAHAAPAPKEKPEPVKLELASLQGTWRRVGGERGGEKFAAEDLKKAEAVWEIKGEQITWRNAENKDGFQTALKINPSKQPNEMDLGPIHINGKLQDNPLGNPWANKGSLGIYELKGDTLRVCYGSGGEDGKQRPKEFKTVPQDPERFPDPHEVILVFERVKQPPAEKKPGGGESPVRVPGGVGPGTGTGTPGDGESPVRGSGGGEKAKNGKDAIEGYWLLVAKEHNGKSESYPQGVGVTLTLSGGKYNLHTESLNPMGGLTTGNHSESPFKHDPKAKTIDLPNRLGVYKVDGDKLTICWGQLPQGNAAASDRPKEFSTRPDSGRVLNVWQRIKPDRQDGDSGKP